MSLLGLFSLLRASPTRTRRARAAKPLSQSTRAIHRKPDILKKSWGKVRNPEDCWRSTVLSKELNATPPGSDSSCRSLAPSLPCWPCYGPSARGEARWHGAQTIRYVLPPVSLFRKKEGRSASKQIWHKAAGCTSSVPARAPGPDWGMNCVS